MSAVADVNAVNVNVAVEDFKLQKRAAKAVLWLCVLCLAFAFLCVGLKLDPSTKMLDFIVWIVGLTFAALMGSDGIELLKTSKVKT